MSKKNKKKNRKKTNVIFILYIIVLYILIIFSFIYFVVSKLSKGQILAEDISGISNSGKPWKRFGVFSNCPRTALKIYSFKSPTSWKPLKLESSLTSLFEVILHQPGKPGVPTGFIGSSKTHLSALGNHSGFQGSEKSWKIRAPSWKMSWVSLLRFHGNGSCNVWTEETDSNRTPSKISEFFNVYWLNKKQKH